MPPGGLLPSLLTLAESTSGFYTWVLAWPSQKEGPLLLRRIPSARLVLGELDFKARVPTPDPVAL